MSKFLFFFLLLPQIIFAQNTEKEFKKMDSLGKLHWQTASYYLASSYYQKALTIAQNTKNEEWEARALNYLGVIAENKGDFQKAFDYHFKALRINEKNNNKMALAKSYINIGITYYSAGDKEKALLYYFKCIDLAKEATENIAKFQKTHAYYHISTIYREQKKYKEATEYAQNALKFAIEINEKIIIIDAQNGLGLIATEQKEYQKGRDFYQKVYDLAIKENDWLIVTNNLQHFAENYQQEAQFDKAIEYAQKSLELAKKYDLKAEEKNAYHILKNIYTKIQNFQEAFNVYTKENTLKDSLFNLQKSQQINEITIQYETENKVKVLQHQKIMLVIQAKETQQLAYLLIFVISLLLIISVLIFYNYQKQKTLRKQQKQMLETVIKLQETENNLKKMQFEQKIANQQRELASNTLHIFQKNEMLNEIQEKLTEFNPDIKNQIKPLFQELKSSIDLDKNWENFQQHFTEVCPNFFTNLQNDFPTLSQNDFKMLAYIRMKMSNKEIATLVNITTKSVEMARYRLKKKFNLGGDDNLDSWLEKY